MFFQIAGTYPGLNHPNLRDPLAWIVCHAFPTPGHESILGRGKGKQLFYWGERVWVVPKINTVRPCRHC
jgi:hypothetical protein